MTSSSNSPYPLFRKLRGYAFDPSLSLKIETSDFNEVIYKVPWEDKLSRGPIGEYIEVIDYDPTIKKRKNKEEKKKEDGIEDYGVFYKSVNLNDPHILATDGLTPSESNPQFHQQMVYAVAMKTIKNFEKALGRKVIWRERYEDNNDWKNKSIRSSYIQRLRIYPHAFREPNAYYSPDKRAILFGYFKSTPSEKQLHMPNSWVFTCLSHDIIAHEVTHAILDGLNIFYNEPTNPDVLAFHEAFADIVALFQHFTMAEVLRSQISQTKGNLENQNLLGKLAQQFGTAIGGYSSLRDAIGHYDQEEKTWKRTEPDVSEYETEMQPHKRGSILVAAVFDAFLTIYKTRVADLIRISTEGTGMLPDGDLHPDLVNRLADEAAKTASQILNICIRAIDYCPPVDITFGEYLRAIITADCDLVDDDDQNYRLAFIDAFKRRGIYPKGIKTLSVESLRYPVLDKSDSIKMKPIINSLKKYSRKMKFRPGRYNIYYHTEKHIIGGKPENGEEGVDGLHDILHELMNKDGFENLTGMFSNSTLTDYGVYNGKEEMKSDDETNVTAGDYKDGEPANWITNLREISRVGPSGKKVNQIRFSIVQTARLLLDEHEEIETGTYAFEDPKFKDPEKYMAFRGGTTFIFDLDTESLKYSIRKPIFDKDDTDELNITRMTEQYLYQFDPEMTGMTDMEKYFGLTRHSAFQEPFALLHNH